MCGFKYVRKAKATLLFCPPDRNFIGFRASSPWISNFPRCALKSVSEAVFHRLIIFDKADD